MIGQIPVPRRPRLLDLFCGAGGAAKGYHDAGFEVVGVDIEDQRRYPYEFHEGHALEYLRKHGAEFDAVHASPPCQAHTSLRVLHNAIPHSDWIPATRNMLRRLGKPYVIENVEGAPLANPVTLCGTMFDLGCDGAELQRHRLFECSFPVLQPECRHGRKPATIGIYGGHVRNRKRRTEGNTHRGVYDFTPEQGREAMGIDWMTLAELSQAVPPAYTRYIGSFLMQAVREVADAA